MGISKIMEHLNNWRHYIEEDYKLETDIIIGLIIKMWDI